MNKPKLLYGQDKIVRPWVASRIPYSVSLDDDRNKSIGVMLNDKLIAGFIFHDYSEIYKTIQVSMAADSFLWARKDLIDQVLHYPFVQLGVYKVYTLTPVNNKKAIKVNQSIGFEKDCEINHIFGYNVNGIVQEYLADKYFNKKQEIPHAASA